MPRTARHLDSQPSLFDAPLTTSDAAWKHAQPRVPGRRQLILELMRQRGTLTIWEAAAALGVHDHQISGRFSELEHKGLIEKAGERRLKPGTRCEAEAYRVRVTGGVA